MRMVAQVHVNERQSLKTTETASDKEDGGVAQSGLGTRSVVGLV